MTLPRDAELRRRRLARIARGARLRERPRGDPRRDRDLTAASLTRRFADIGRGDIGIVGGKNASLGEMMSKLRSAGVRVPNGFATTAKAYWAFVEHNDHKPRIAGLLDSLESDGSNVAAVGKKIRALFTEARMPEEVAQAIGDGYRALGGPGRGRKAAVAVRSSATAEDLPEASFAGQLESILNVRSESELLDACKRCFASLFTDRAIGYREKHGFDHLDIALSVGVQSMVRADKACAGVMFTLDTESGFDKVVMIDSAWGLGESVVQGIVDPDEYHVLKPLLADPSLTPIIEKKLGRKEKKTIYGRGRHENTTVARVGRDERRRFTLTDAEVLELARWAVAIEAHYGCGMDIEWAKDGRSGELFVVQARPETVQTRRAGETFEQYRLEKSGAALVHGTAIGNQIATGRVRRLERPDQTDGFAKGDVLVTSMTDPDWVPIMLKASAIVTDHGGRTSHAAIVSRELGVPAVIGTGDATHRLENGREVTVSCAEGDDGVVYEGALPFRAEETSIAEVPETRTRVMVNLANPAAAYRWWRLPAAGVGLARIEFIIGNLIRFHPLALARAGKLSDRRMRQRIRSATRGYADPAEYFVDKLARGIARLAAVYYPEPVVVRLSDFKSNEYAQLLGGRSFEPDEPNPMLGWRGASRYYSAEYAEAFALECRAVAKARQELGLTNIAIMVPFCRTLGEADRVLEALDANGLGRRANGLEVFVMAEVPSNVVLASQFAERFDGFSIGSNDLTQLLLGVDRDNESLGTLFDERDEAVQAAIADLLAKARAGGIKTGICGQAPSDHPEFARFLVDQQIDSISVTPDSFFRVKEHVASAEAANGRG